MLHAGPPSGRATTCGMAMSRWQPRSDPTSFCHSCPCPPPRAQQLSAHPRPWWGALGRACLRARSMSAVSLGAARREGAWARRLVSATPLTSRPGFGGASCVPSGARSGVGGWDRMDR
eukprot:scaffold1827_cov421-Prasinococcus_capsulatus_cf.AAC.10